MELLRADALRALEPCQRARHDLGILQGELPVVEQQLYRRRDLRGRSVVCRVENPHRLGQDQMRNPCPCRNEGLGQGDLRSVVAVVGAPPQAPKPGLAP